LIGGWAGVGAVSAAIASLVMCRDQWAGGVVLLFVALSLGEAAVLRVVGLRSAPQTWVVISPVVALPASYAAGAIYFTVGLLLAIVMFGSAIVGSAPAAGASARVITYMFYGAAVVTVPIALVLSAVQSGILTQGTPSTPLRWWVLVVVAGLALGIFVPQPGGGPMLACHPDQLGDAFAFLPAFATPALCGAIYGAFRGLALGPVVEVARAAGR